MTYKWLFAVGNLEKNYIGNKLSNLSKLYAGSLDMFFYGMGLNSLLYYSSLLLELGANLHNKMDNTQGRSHQIGFILLEPNSGSKPVLCSEKF